MGEGNKSGFRGSKDIKESLFDESSNVTAAETISTTTAHSLYNNSSRLMNLNKTRKETVIESDVETEKEKETTQETDLLCH